MQTVAPASSAPTCEFHMIQPDDEYQWKRSPGATSSCSRVSFSPTSAAPPWPCTIAFGVPVVPLE